MNECEFLKFIPSKLAIIAKRLRNRQLKARNYQRINKRSGNALAFKNKNGRSISDFLAAYNEDEDLREIMELYTTENELARKRTMVNSEVQEYNAKEENINSNNLLSAPGKMSTFLSDSRAPRSGLLRMSNQSSVLRNENQPKRLSLISSKLDKNFNFEGPRSSSIIIPQSSLNIPERPQNKDLSSISDLDTTEGKFLQMNSIKFSSPLFDASSDDSKEASLNFEEKLDQPRNLLNKSMFPKTNARKLSRIIQVSPNEISNDVLKSNKEVFKGKQGESEANFQGIVDIDRINCFQFYFPLGNVERFVYKYNNYSKKMRLRGFRRPEPNF